MATPRRNAELDPETDFVRIYRDLGQYEFPWDFNQSLSFALFRTYAVPSIGRLLDETHEFTERTQRRYDDTALLLDEVITQGFDSPDGLAAVRRINGMHPMYDISNDDMRYVLSTFVVVPKRWIDRFGWRALTPGEVTASVRYYQELGLLRPALTTPGGTRQYSDREVDRLRRILELRDHVGLDLERIGEILRAEDRLAQLRSEAKESPTPARRREIIQEAIEVNAHMQEQVRAKLDALTGYLDELTANASRYAGLLTEAEEPATTA